MREHRLIPELAVGELEYDTVLILGIKDSFG